MPTDVIFAGDNVIINVDTIDNVGIDALYFYLDGTLVPAKRVSATGWLLLAPIGPGSHEVVVKAVDYAGNEARSQSAAFRIINEAISREWSVFQWEQDRVRDAITREVSVFYFDSRDSELNDAVSREVSVFALEGDVGTYTDAISREISVYQWEASSLLGEAISREWSVENRPPN